MIHLPLRVAGRYKLTAIRPDGSTRKLTDWFDNLILDSGLDLIGTSSTYLDACQIGTSGAAEDAAQTALLAPTAGTATRVSAFSSAANTPPYKGSSAITYRFPVGVAAGELFEVGVGPSATEGSTLFSRSLIRNLVGEATGVLVFDDEILDVQYQLTVLPPAGDLSGGFNLAGIDYSYTLRAARITANANWAPYRASQVAVAGQAVRGIFTATTGAHAIAYNGAIRGEDSFPTSTASANCSSVTNTAYVPGSHKAAALLRWLDTAANFAEGFRSAEFGFAPVTGDGGNSIGWYQVEFTPPIPKSANETLLLSVEVSWGRG